jgi:hypothetical protein
MFKSAGTAALKAAFPAVSGDLAMALKLDRWISRSWRQDARLLLLEYPAER